MRIEPDHFRERVFNAVDLVHIEHRTGMMHRHGRRRAVEPRRLCIACYRLRIRHINCLQSWQATPAGGKFRFATHTAGVREIDE